MGPQGLLIGVKGVLSFSDRISGAHRVLLKCTIAPEALIHRNSALLSFLKGWGPFRGFRGARSSIGLLGLPGQ